MNTFTRTVQQWGGISHNPHIVEVVDSGDDPRPWVAVETEGRPLLDEIASLDRTDRLRVLEGVIEGLETASLYNVAHGAIAPETVEVQGAGDDITGALTDWGLQRTVQDALGEPPVRPYTAPEQLDGATAPTTDVYRVGMLAYRLLTDREPFADANDLETAIRNGDLTPPTEVADLPARVDEIIATATATDPADRYESVLDFREMIREALS